MTGVLRRVGARSPDGLGATRGTSEMGSAGGPGGRVSGRDWNKARAWMGSWVTRPWRSSHAVHAAEASSLGRACDRGRVLRTEKGNIVPHPRELLGPGKCPRICQVTERCRRT